jgi:hypothetical protein
VTQIAQRKAVAISAQSASSDEFQVSLSSYKTQNFQEAQELPGSFVLA